jgi:hypothetical protein
MHLATHRSVLVSWTTRATYAARLRLMAALLGAAAALATTACGDDDPISPTARARGEYDLTLIADPTGRSAPLPVTTQLTNGPQTITVVFQSGRLELREGDAYQLTIAVTANGTADQITSEGTYRVDQDGVVTFTQTEGDVGQGFGGEFDDEGQLTVQIIGGLDFIFIRGDDT